MKFRKICSAIREGLLDLAPNQTDVLREKSRESQNNRKEGYSDQVQQYYVRLRLSYLKVMIAV